MVELERRARRDGWHAARLRFYPDQTWRRTSEGVLAHYLLLRTAMGEQSGTSPTVRRESTRCKEYVTTVSEGVCAQISRQRCRRPVSVHPDIAKIGLQPGLHGLAECSTCSRDFADLTNGGATIMALAYWRAASLRAADDRRRGKGSDARARHAVARGAKRRDGNFLTTARAMSTRYCGCCQDPQSRQLLVRRFRPSPASRQANGGGRSRRELPSSNS